MQHQRKADRADRLRHRRADVVPAFRRAGPAGRCRSGSGGTAGPVASGCRRTQCGSWPNSGVGSGRKSARTPRLSGMPVGAGVGGFEDAAAGHPDVQVARVERVDEDRVQLAAVGRAVLVAAAPRLARGCSLNPATPIPGRAAVVGAEQALRRGARVPDARFRRVSRGQPERVVDHAPLPRGERRRAARPPVQRAPAVGGAEDRRPEVAGARGGQQRAPSRGSATAWWTMWPRKCGPASVQLRRVGSLRVPQALAGGDVQR